MGWWVWVGEDREGERHRGKEEEKEGRGGDTVRLSAPQEADGPKMARKKLHAQFYF